MFVLFLQAFDSFVLHETSFLDRNCYETMLFPKQSSSGCPLCPFRQPVPLLQTIKAFLGSFKKYRKAIFSTRYRDGEDNRSTLCICKNGLDLQRQLQGERSDEKRLTIHKGFWMWQMEVTQGQYKALTGENPAHFKKCGLKCPVESVSWSEVAQFANKLSKAQRLETCFLDDGSRLKPQFRKGRAYNTCKGWRLPTELEWKYTVRAGRNAGSANKTSLVQEKPVPVASSPPNLWGLYDIDGNVNEWTLDWGQSRGSNVWNRMLSNCFRVKTGDGRHLPNRRVPPCKIKFNLSSRVPSLGFRLVRSP